MASSPSPTKGFKPPALLPIQPGFVDSCNPGPEQRQYIDAAVMAEVSRGLAKVLEEQSANPVHTLAQVLRNAAPTSSGDGCVSQLFPVLLDNVDRMAMSGTMLSTLPDEAKADATQELRFTHRPSPAAQLKGLPRRFERSGPHPVFGLDLPHSKELLGIAQHIHEETGVKRIIWAVVGCGDVQLYSNGRAFRATPAREQWNTIRQRVVADNMELNSLNRSSCVFDHGPSRDYSGRLEDEFVASITASIKAAEKAEAVRNAIRAREANAAAANPAEVLLSVSEPGRAQTPLSPKRARYDGLNPRHVATVSATLQSACAAAPCKQHVVRLQHPTDAVVSAEFCDEITKLCDEAVDGDGEAAIVVVSTDRWSLVRHVQALVTLYFVVRSEVQHMKRLANVADAASKSKTQTYAREVAIEVAQRRKARDERRDWLVKAHAQALYDQRHEDSASILERRTGIKQARNQRRRRDDEARDHIETEQSDLAASKIQNVTRSAVLRRLSRNESRRLFTSRRVATVDASERRRKLKEKYAEGHFPLVKHLIESLMSFFGVEFVTNERPQTSGTRAYRQWHVAFKRVEPVDDLDVSSEEEEWTSCMAERVVTSVTSAFNPVYHAQMAWKFAGSDDFSTMLDLFADYGGLASYQRRGMNCLERFATGVQFATHLSFHHKRRLASGYREGDMSEKIQQLTKLPAKVQGVATYVQFCALHSHGQELINHSSWIAPYLVRQPALLHQPCQNRLLIGNRSPNGSFATIQDVVLAPAAAQLKNPSTAAGEFVQQLHAKLPMYLVAEHVSIEQWTDSVAGVLKKSHGARRVLWLNMRPDLTVYVNEVPLFAVSRPEHLNHDGTLRDYSCARNANINNCHLPVDYIPVKQQKADFAASTASMSGNNARDVVMRSPTPNMDNYGAIGQSMELNSSQSPSRRAANKELQLPTTWLGVNWDQYERELCTEIAELIDSSDDGKLPFYTQTAASFGPGVPIAHIQTTLSDRPGRGIAQPYPEQPVAPRAPEPGFKSGAPSMAGQSLAGQSLAHKGRDALSNDERSAASERSPNVDSGLVPPRSVAADSVDPSRQTTPRALSHKASMQSRAAPSQAPALTTASGAPDATPAMTAINAVVDAPARQDREVIVARHTIQALRPKPRRVEPQNRVSMSTRTISMTNPGNVSPGESSMTPTKNGNMESFAGALTESLAVEHGTVGPNAQPGKRGPALRGKSMAEGTHRKTVRGLQGLRNRQSSIASIVSDQPTEDDAAFANLPTRGTEACMTPWQAADEVRLRLKRKYALDNAMTFRRVPVFPSSGNEWLRFVDQLYVLAHEQFGDPYLAVVFGVSDVESVFHAALCSIVWVLEHGKSSMLGIPEATDTAWAAEANATNRSLTDIFTSNVDFNATSATAPPPSNYAVMNRLVEENKRIDLLESLRFVDTLLVQLRIRDALIGPIDFHTEAAELAAAAPDADSPDKRALITWHARKAAQALERYAIMVLFHHFVRFTQEKRQVMSMMQVDFSFAEHITSMPHVVHLLDHIDPWEGRTDYSPLPPFAVGLHRDMRWRRRHWVSTIG